MTAVFMTDCLILKDDPKYDHMANRMALRHEFPNIDIFFYNHSLQIVYCMDGQMKFSDLRAENIDFLKKELLDKNPDRFFMLPVAGDRNTEFVVNSLVLSIQDSASKFDDWSESAFKVLCKKWDIELLILMCGPNSIPIVYCPYHDGGEFKYEEKELQDFAKKFL